MTRYLRDIYVILFGKQISLMCNALLMQKYSNMKQVFLKITKICNILKHFTLYPHRKIKCITAKFLNFINRGIEKYQMIVFRRDLNLSKIFRL